MTATESKQRMDFIHAGKIDKVSVKSSEFTDKVTVRVTVGGNVYESTGKSSEEAAAFLKMYHFIPVGTRIEGQSTQN